MRLKLSKQRGAFSLVELIVASVIMAMVFLAMVSLLSFALKSKTKQWRRQMVFSQTAYAVRLISRSLMNASYIVKPDPGETGSPTLLAYYNANPLDKLNSASKEKMAPGEPQGYFLYCLNQEGNKIYRYAGEGNFPLSLTPFACGQSPVSPMVRELLVDTSGSSRMSVGLSFSMTAGMPTVVHIDYLVRYDTEEITGRADTQLQQSL